VVSKLELNGHLAIPSLLVPSFRTAYAVQQGIEKNILMVTWGGLGDQICAEPTLRFALKTFKDCSVSLASECPQLFEHLPFKKVYNLKREQPVWEDYFPFQTIRPPTDLTWEFMSHMITNCVDFPSLCAFRCQLPIADRVVTLEPPQEIMDKIYGEYLHQINYPIVIHAGRHWPSKTFPKVWWDKVISNLVDQNVTPILIGADTDDNRGTVDVETKGCLDLRNKLSILESIALLNFSQVLLTNDSSPLHMAVSGNTWIGFVATCKHPDYIMHWRRDTNGLPQWAWRMENLGLGGIWETIDYCPNRENAVTAEKVPEDLLSSWLPPPEKFAGWALSRLNTSRFI